MREGGDVGYRMLVVWLMLSICRHYWFGKAVKESLLVLFNAISECLFPRFKHAMCSDGCRALSVSIWSDLRRFKIHCAINGMVPNLVFDSPESRIDKLPIVLELNDTH